MSAVKSPLHAASRLLALRHCGGPYNVGVQCLSRLWKADVVQQLSQPPAHMQTRGHMPDSTHTKNITHFLISRVSPIAGMKGDRWCEDATYPTPPTSPARGLVHQACRELQVSEQLREAGPQRLPCPAVVVHTQHTWQRSMFGVCDPCRCAEAGGCHQAKRPQICTPWVVGQPQVAADDVLQQALRLLLLGLHGASVMQQRQK